MMLHLLPSEILLKILNDNCILAEDLLSLSRVCYIFKDISNIKNLWKSKFCQRWPRVWKKINSVGFTIRDESEEDWKSETVAALSIIHKLHKRMKKIRYESFNWLHESPGVMSCIFDLFKIGKFGALHVLNELISIVQKNNQEDLTTLYYAKLVLYHAHKYVTEEEFKTFIELPHEKQILEKGVFHLANCFLSQKYFDIDYYQISSSLDALTLEVQSHLRNENCDHPSASIKLFSPDENFENFILTELECMDIFNSVNYIFYTEKKFRVIWTPSSIEDFLLLETLEKKSGYVAILCVVYQAVCARLGVSLQVVSCGYYDEMLLQWKVPGSQNVKYINPCQEGDLLDEFIFYGEETDVEDEDHDDDDDNDDDNDDDDDDDEDLISKFTNFEIIVEIFRTHTKFKHEISLPLALLPDEVTFRSTGLMLLYQPTNSAYKKYRFPDFGKIIYNYYLTNEIHVDIVKERCKNISEEQSNETMKQILEFAETELSNRPSSIIPKRRTESENSVKYATGMIVRYKPKNYVGVIISWDTVFDEKERENFPGMCNFEQPFYLLITQQDLPIYVAEECLEVVEKPAQINHFKIGKYFKKFDGTFYIPNEERCLRYPDDESVRQQFLVSKLNI